MDFSKLNQTQQPTDTDKNTTPVDNPWKRKRAERNNPSSTHTTTPVQPSTENINNADKSVNDTTYDSSENTIENNEKVEKTFENFEKNIEPSAENINANNTTENNTTQQEQKDLTKTTTKKPTTHIVTKKKKVDNRKPYRDYTTTVGRQATPENLVTPDGLPITKSTIRQTNPEAFDKLVQAAQTNQIVILPEKVLEQPELYTPTVSDTSLQGHIVFPWKDLKSTLGGEKNIDRKKMNQKELEIFRNAKSRRDSFLDTEDFENFRNLQKPGSKKREHIAVAATINKGSRGTRKRTRSSIDERDMDILKFLAKMKYANAKTISHLWGVTEKTATERLVKLKEKGLVVDGYPAGRFWTCTNTGMELTGYDLPVFRLQNFSYAQFHHQTIVNNIAANMWNNKANVLNLENFPQKNKLTMRQIPTWGDTIVSELEIQSSFSIFKSVNNAFKTTEYTTLVDVTIHNAFKEWQQALQHNPELPSPEQMPTNEYMWILFPDKMIADVSYHAPDLVISRPRTPEGKPQSIAVEIERNPKALSKYETTMNIYAQDDKIYDKVIWVVLHAGPAAAIEKAAREVGLIQNGRLDIVPVINNEGNIIRKSDDILTL